LKRLIVIFTLLLAAGSVVAQGETISPALNDQLNTLVTITERLRGLDTVDPVEHDFPTRQETIDYLTELYARDLPAEELEQARLLYVALDLLPADIDLRAVYLELLGSQVAGFYDSDTRIMNVIPTVGDQVGDELSLTEQIVFVHEYTHALQDQHFGLNMLEDEALQSAPDRSLAAVALVEGDASATMQVYSQEVMMRNPGAAFQLLAEGAIAGNLFLPEGIPAVLARELMFPYEAGLSFVLELYDDGGWQRINAAYDDLPQTTEQVIHPEKYLAGEGAQSVAGADLAPGGGWQQVWDITLGEFYLTEHLRTQLPATQARRAAAGWGGDRFQMYVDPESNDLIWSLELVWDTPEEQAEFAEAYAQLGDEKFGSAAVEGCWSNDGAALCFVDGDSVSQIVSAPSLEMARTALSAASEG
jgi:hypothetical protein